MYFCLIHKHKHFKISQLRKNSIVMLQSPKDQVVMARMQKQIEDRLAADNIHASIFSRIKHIYSIYRKMYAQKLDINGIFDLCAFRVIVDSIPDCYNVLGIIHDMFKPVPGRFKDYISTPKPNMYQSVHTTVIGSEGIPFEVQIRTWEMHRTAEYGVAAHWKYKMGNPAVGDGEEESYAWVRRLLESQQDSDASDFFHNLKIDMFADEVFVFSPKGDVINLPAGATPIDFAYSIHSGVGNTMAAGDDGRGVDGAAPEQKAVDRGVWYVQLRTLDERFAAGFKHDAGPVPHQPDQHQPAHHADEDVICGREWGHLACPGVLLVVQIVVQVVIAAGDGHLLVLLLCLLPQHAFFADLDPQAYRNGDAGGGTQNQCGKENENKGALIVSAKNPVSHLSDPPCRLILPGSE